MAALNEVPLSERVGRLLVRAAKLERLGRQLDDIEGELDQWEGTATPLTSPEPRSLPDTIRSLREIASRMSGSAGEPNPKSADALLSLECDVRIAEGDNHIRLTRASLAANSARTLAANRIASIGHGPSNTRAQAYLKSMDELLRNIQTVNKTPGAAVEDPDGERMIAVLGEIGRCLGNILTLHVQETKRVTKTEWTVAWFAATAVVLIAAVTTVLLLEGTGDVPIGSIKLESYRLPFMGVPWPVLVWGFIGSIAATIHRFNSNPSYDFNDVLKWMITRPIQGMLLSAAVYLLLVSGIHVLNAGVVEANSAGVVADTFILVMCFLVGFSDRVANGLLETVVQKYSGSSHPFHQSSPPAQTQSS